ncbi:hypothetical protein RHMOL_Rhmol08G0173500 [Rhododendron molle]|uniref:Uncharacterized protein n=1 Tax=Rhododendron molle TaxID=49168 RepID=A0ACC0MP87_RHOML|nr:hypothetical protein RHMOL_Rhmol08G0173500 [Rhododendron molle]
MELKGAHEVKSVIKVEEICAICEMAGHSTSECFNIPALKNVLNSMSPKEVSAIQRFEPYPNTFNQAQRQHPALRWNQPQEVGQFQGPQPVQNQTWRSPQNFGPPRFQQNQGPPGFNPSGFSQGQSSQGQGQFQSPPPQSRSWEDSMQSFFQSQTAMSEQNTQAIADLRTQMGKLATSVGLLQQERGKFPAQPLANPQGQNLVGSSSVSLPEQAKSIITLRSGKVVDNAQVEPPVPTFLKTAPEPTSSTSDGESPKQAPREMANIPIGSQVSPVPAPYPQRRSFLRNK